MAVLALYLTACGQESEQAGTPPPPRAGASDALEAAAAQRWMTYQYENPRPQEAPAMVETLIRSGWHEINPEANALGLLVVFLGRLGAAHPGVLDAWAESAAGLSPEARFVFAHAIRDADPTNARARVMPLAESLGEEDRAVLTGLLDEAPTDPAALSPEAPMVLDFWWAAFMATGDTAWVDLVLGVIPAPGVSFEESGLDDPARLEVARAAAWSLSSNGAQHPRVLEHLKKRLDEAGGDWPTVAALVEQAERGASGVPTGPGG